MRTPQNQLSRGVGVVAALFFLWLMFVEIFSGSGQRQNLVINEVAFVQDGEGDWIEIYNPTLNNLSLEGLYLSDNNEDYQKYQITEAIVVPAGGFVVISGRGSHDNYTIETNFRISNGETVYLMASDGVTVLDSMTVLLPDDDTRNITVGRYPDGSDNIFLLSAASQGKKNRSN